MADNTPATPTAPSPLPPAGPYSFTDLARIGHAANLLKTPHTFREVLAAAAGEHAPDAATVAHNAAGCLAVLVAAHARALAAMAGAACTIDAAEMTQMEIDLYEVIDGMDGDMLGRPISDLRAMLCHAATGAAVATWQADPEAPIAECPGSGPAGINCGCTVPRGATLCPTCARRE